MKKNSFLKKFGLSVLIADLTMMLAACGGGAPLWTKAPVGIDTIPAVFSGTLNVYLDGSGSMKGYVDVKEPYLRDKLPIILSDLRNNLKCTSETEAYYVVKDWNESTKPVPIGWDEFKAASREASSFGGKDTQLHAIMGKISESLGKGDVGMLITDGVLSMGSSFFDTHKDEDNSNYLGELTASVKETLDKMQSKGLGIALVRTTANFNGKYYYACNEKTVAQYADSIMRNRPLYFILIGQEKVLEKVMASINVKESDASLYQTTLFSGTSQPVAYSIAPTEYCAGLNSINYHYADEVEDSTTLDVHIDLNNFDVDNRLQLCLCLPEMPTGQLLKLDEMAYVDNNKFFTIAPLAKSECRSIVEADDEYWQKVGVCYKLVFNTKDEIRNATSDKGECNISIVYDNQVNCDEYSIGNDLEKKLSEMEGRTFGLSNIMEAANISAYKKNMVGNKSKKATIKFNIIID